MLFSLPALLSFVLTPLAHDGSSAPMDALRQRARELADAPYVKRSTDDLPRWLADLDFDGYRQIVFRPQATLWSGEGLPFQLRFAHRGYLYPQRLPIHLVDEEGVAEAAFDPAQFEYRFEWRGDVPQELGYAGLAVLVPREPGVWSELASFLGASYFRVTGEGQRYGASARGLAIDTASPGGEEFPEFVEVWLQRPAPDDEGLELRALLDSPSTSGAYRFVLRPGAETLLEVEAWLYPRREIAKLGLAPLTSMFLFGEERLRLFRDFRPEVHDSDGVAIATADGEWLWRPLTNPEGKHRVTRVPLDGPKGFGLLQRDRSFASYEDLETRAEQRTSYWVTPRGDAWEGGDLELVEVPSDHEHNDNIVLYWVPRRAPVPGEELAVQYTLSAFLDDPGRPPLARVRATRTRPSEGAVLFVLDFDGPGLDDFTGLVADVRSGAGDLHSVVLQSNAAEGGTRLTFELAGAGRETVELRAALRRDDRPVSETWLFHWTSP